MTPKFQSLNLALSHVPAIFRKLWSVKLRILFILTLSQTCPCLQYKSNINTLGKKEIARNEQFLLSSHRFLPICANFNFSGTLVLSIVISSNFNSSQILSPGKWLSSGKLFRCLQCSWNYLYIFES